MTSGHAVCVSEVQTVKRLQRLQFLRNQDIKKLRVIYFVFQMVILFLFNYAILTHVFKKKIGKEL